MKCFQTFRFRLSVQCTLVLSIILGLSSLGIYFGLRRTLYQNLDASLWAIAESEVASAFDAPDGTAHVHTIEAPLSLAWNASRLDKFVQIWTFPEGKVVAKSQNLGSTELPLHPEDIGPFSQGVVLLETVQTAGFPPMRLLSLPVLMEGNVHYVIQVGTSLAPVESTLLGLFWLLMVMDGSALVFTGIGGAFLAYRALRPVNRIVRDIEHIESKNLHQRLDISHTGDEIGRLIEVLNRMLDRLAQSFHSQQRFIADASHELRSPLANLRMALELALRRTRTTAEYHQVLQSALEEVDRLGGLVKGLLTLARADSAHLETAQDPVPLQPLLQRVLADYQLRAKEKGLSVELSLPALMVRGDSEWLYQLFANLIDNALRYTPAPGTVRVIGSKQNGTAKVQVIDTGIGIAPQHLAHLFERFYRVDKERSREEGGSGLGLAICQEIVRVHGGTLTVESTVGKGSIFTVFLPALL
jgi:heavy metal sensor kinase